MDISYYNLLEITRASITRTQARLRDNVNWQEQMSLLQKGKLLSVTYNTATMVQGDNAVPSDVLAAWRDFTVLGGLKQMQMTNELNRVLKEAEKIGISFVVFKGITLAALYPEPYTRLTSDVDLLVSEEQREAAERLLVELGYVKQEDVSKEHVPVYKISIDGRYLVIELHDLLWEDYKGRQAEILLGLCLDKEDTLIEQNVCGCKVITLGYSEHLIYQIYHIAKHLFFEGVALRYLVDIALYIDAYAEKIDFSRVNKALRDLHYENFYYAILKICHTYLGMKTNVLGDALDTIDINEQLLEDIISVEKLDDTVRKWETINFLEQYFMRTSFTKQSDFQQIRKQVLPFPSELNDRFSYAKRCPILLPVAWVHRVIYMIKYSKHCERNGFTSSASIEKAQRRLNLMRKLGITETDKEVQDLLKEEDI